MKRFLFSLLLVSLVMVACEKAETKSEGHPAVYEYIYEPDLKQNEIALGDSIVTGNTQFTTEEAYELLQCNTDEAWYIYEIREHKLQSEQYEYIYTPNKTRVFPKVVKEKTYAGNVFGGPYCDVCLAVVGFNAENKYVLYNPENNKVKNWPFVIGKSKERSFTLEGNKLNCPVVPGLSTQSRPRTFILVSVEQDRLIFDIEQVFQNTDTEIEFEHDAITGTSNRIYGQRHVAYKKKFNELKDLPIIDDLYFR